MKMLFRKFLSMRVTRIEIFGFKSFLEKLALPLEQGVTAVVGPNGCGKSNIVDALRWVLGETRASQLRGAALEDVIFNGTDTLRPLGLAEVTITLRATEKDFFTHVLAPILKRATRAPLAVVPNSTSSVSTGPNSNGMGPEEFPSLGAAPTDLTNNEPAAVSDEPARPALRVISRSNGEALDFSNIESNGEEAGGEGRHVQISEVALDAEAIGELGEVAANDGDAGEEYLQQIAGRYAWLQGVQEVQVTRRLYRSGESEFFLNRVACRLRDLKELFRLVGLGARSYTIVAQGEVGRIISARPEDRRLIVEEAAGVAGFRDKISAATRRLEETDTNLVRLDDVIKEVTRQVNSLRVQASRAKNREQLKIRLGEIGRQLFADDMCAIRQKIAAAIAARSESASQLELRIAALTLAETREIEARELALREDQEADRLHGELDNLQEELRQYDARRLSLSEKMSALGAKRSSVAAEINSLNEREGTLQLRHSEAAESVGELNQADSKISAEISGLSNDSESRVQAINEELGQLRIQMRSQEKTVREARDEVVRLESRLRALEEQMRAFCPLNGLRASLEPRSGANRELTELTEYLARLTAGHKVLGDYLEVPAELNTALQAVLQEKAAYVVAENSYDVALELAALIGKARTTGGLGERSKPFALGVLTKRAESFRAAYGDLRAQLRDAYQPLVELIQIDPAVRGLVEALFGDVFVCGSLEDAIAASKIYLESDLAPVFVSRGGDVISRQGVHSGGTERGFFVTQSEVSQLRLALQAARELHHAAGEVQEELIGKVKQTEAAQAIALRENQERQAVSRALASQQGQVRGRLQAEKRLLDQLHGDIVALQHSRIQKSQLVGSLEEQLQAIKLEQTSVVARGEAFESAARGRLLELRAQLTEVETRRRANRMALSESASTVQQARQARDEAKGVLARLDFDLERNRLSAQNMRDRACAELGSDIVVELEAKALDAGDGPMPQAVKDELHSEQERIRTRIVREGDVDASSIQRFDEESARLVDLTTQRADLETAAKTLRATIERLRKTSEERFVATFRAVSRNFSDLVPRLFGGGHGSLALTDPEHPLESGVEITVRPPGKKLKSIELMSGGEKALCAIAMIVSMFLERPSPLCILDEVDAPLDDANLVRFLSLVKDMSSKTQFVMITHNKQSMSVADRLVGVTMPQPGASKVVTVSLQEAFAHVA